MTAAAGTIPGRRRVEPGFGPSTPQPTIPSGGSFGGLLALPPAQQRAQPSETVQLEADLGAMLEAVRGAAAPGRRRWRTRR